MKNERCSKEAFEAFCDELNRKKKSKDYLLTVRERGDIRFSEGDGDREILPRRFFVACSLADIPKWIEGMNGFWKHPDLKNPEVEDDDIPFEEKQFGCYYDIIIEPLTEELEKSYLKASEKGFFETYRKAAIRQAESS